MIDHFVIFFFSIKVTLTEMLIDAESSEYPDAPVNPYRKLLGIEITVLYLTSGNLIHGLMSEIQGLRSEV